MICSIVLSVFLCGVMCSPNIDQFFFHAKSLIANVHLELLSEYVAPQLQVLQSPIIFQQMVPTTLGD